MSRRALTLLPFVALLLAGALGLAACGGEDGGGGSGGAAAATTDAGAGAAPAGTKPNVTVPRGAPPRKLIVKDLEEGTGAEAKAGDQVTVQYVGVSFSNGRQFDASWDRNEPFTFVLGTQQVIKGWDDGIPGMKVGGRRELVIPPDLAYGREGAPPDIGPGEALVFVIDLLDVTPAQGGG